MKNNSDIQERFAGLLTRNQLKENRKEMLFSELHSLLSAGLDFSRSFGLLISAEKDPNTKALLETVYGSVIRGESLWQACEQTGRFSALDYGVIRIGEETGRLGEALSFLTDFYHKKIEQRRMVSGAVSYPLIILCTAIVVVVFMILVIVPMFEQVYARMGGELPALTRWIIGFSQDMPVYAGILLLILIPVAGGLIYFRDDERVRKRVAATYLKIPVVGMILRKNYQSHFCKLLYLLTRSGVPLLQGLTLLETIITFYPYRESFRKICTGLNQGELFADNMAGYADLYDTKLVTLLRVGEETNRLPEMLHKQGEELTRELEYRLKYLGNLLEPLLILFVGILVAVILVAMYLPMFKLGGVMY